MQVNEMNNGELAVSFYVVTYGQIDIVHAYNNFAKKVEEHQEGIAVDIEGMEFYPEHQSLKAEFFSKAEYEHNGKTAI